MPIKMTDDISDIKALGARIILEIEKPPEKSAGGIALIDTTVRHEQDKITIGVLIAAGDVAFYEMGIAPRIGALIYFVKYAGKEIKCGEKYYRIVNDVDVFGYTNEGKSND